MAYVAAISRPFSCVEAWPGDAAEDFASGRSGEVVDDRVVALSAGGMREADQEMRPDGEPSFGACSPDPTPIRYMSVGVLSLIVQHLSEIARPRL